MLAPQKILDRGLRSLRETHHFFVIKVKLNTPILNKIFEREVSAAAAVVAACSLANEK